MSVFRMPSLGADMEEGTVLEWRVAPGQAFRKGDVIVDIDTDKAAFEVEADHDGVLGDILVAPGTTVAVGTPLARLADGAAVPSRSGDRSHRDEEGSAPHRDEEESASHRVEEGASDLEEEGASYREGAYARAPDHRRMSPRARQLARELGVDVSAMSTGSGPDGVIEVADVSAFVEAGGAEGGSRAQASRQDRLRGVIAAAMSRSKREIPHYYLEHVIDLEPALSWLERRNAERGISERVLPGALLLRAVVLGLRAVPELNGHWLEGGLRQADAVHLGVAVALRGGGVIAPALLDAQELPLDALMAALSDVVGRARAGKLRHREMIDGTVTVTSLGDRGRDAVTGVIFPPQVALIGFGTPRVRPWVVDGVVAPRRLVTATLAADHRASDGHRGALLLRAVAESLEHPESL